ncbi:MAG TPA: winged helix-turn-helix domain-containing protein [Acidobacteriaceae bacterium]|nr:winged helix-turn-helix domain-containing protein [Acidobacteriaceae bacterium]
MLYFGAILTWVPRMEEADDRLHSFLPMSDLERARRYRFGIFEADARTGELRRQGIRVKLHAQPFQILLLLLERPGELLTREEIARALWPEGTFTDYEHGVNSAMNRLREALRDNASSPRFIETLARRGYRFIAPVERIEAQEVASSNGEARAVSPQEAQAAREDAPELWGGGLLASPEELPRVSQPVAQWLFLALQAMYLAFYVSALANLGEIEGLFAALPRPETALIVLIVTAAVLIPVRAFVITGVVLRAPSVREKLLRLWLFLLPLDELWALSPFLLLHHINVGVALSCTALLAWSPFVQRSLVLMGAGARQEGAGTTQ